MFSPSSYLKIGDAGTKGLLATITYIDDNHIEHTINNIETFNKVYSEFDENYHIKMKTEYIAVIYIVKDSYSPQKILKTIYKLEPFDNYMMGWWPLFYNIDKTQYIQVNNDELGGGTSDDNSLNIVLSPSCTGFPYEDD